LTVGSVESGRFFFDFSSSLLDVVEGLLLNESATIQPVP
jgi:hypothetical protein